jgi:hypothetical protein
MGRVRAMVKWRGGQVGRAVAVREGVGRVEMAQVKVGKGMVGSGSAQTSTWIIRDQGVRTKGKGSRGTVAQ